MSLISFIILLLFICKYVIVICVQMYIDIISIIVGVLRRRILWSFCREIFIFNFLALLLLNRTLCIMCRL